MKNIYNGRVARKVEVQKEEETVKVMTGGIILGLRGGAAVKAKAVTRPCR